MRLEDINRIDHVALFEAITSSGMGRIGAQTINMKALQQEWEKSGKPANLYNLWKFLRRAGLSDEQAQQAFEAIGIKPEQISLAAAPRQQTQQAPPVSTDSWYAQQQAGATGQENRTPTVDQIAQMVQAHPSIYEEVRKLLSTAFQQRQRQEQLARRGLK